jgi:hypothetical protein
MTAGGWIVWVLAVIIVLGLVAAAVLWRTRERSRRRDREATSARENDAAQRSRFADGEPFARWKPMRKQQPRSPGLTGRTLTPDAARLGQGEQLVTFLEDHALLYDIPVKRIWASDEKHPPVARRIERLREQAASGNQSFCSGLRWELSRYSSSLAIRPSRMVTFMQAGMLNASPPLTRVPCTTCCWT